MPASRERMRTEFLDISSSPHVGCLIQSPQRVDYSSYVKKSECWKKESA